MKGAEEIESILSQELKDFNRNRIIVFSINSENFKSAAQFAVSYLVEEKKFNGIYISLNEMSKALMSKLGTNNINVSKLHFIDCVSEKADIGLRDNVTIVSGPKALSEISLAITELNYNGKYDFIFLDSVSTMLVYNKAETTEKFVHYLTSKMRSLNLIGIILAVEEENSKKIVPVISQFSDRVLQL